MLWPSTYTLVPFAFRTLSSVGRGVLGIIPYWKLEQPPQYT